MPTHQEEVGRAWARLGAAPAGEVLKARSIPITGIRDAHGRRGPNVGPSISVAPLDSKASRHYLQSMPDTDHGMDDGLTPDDMRTYGAEDMEELASILDALDGANGVEADEETRPGALWKRVERATRRPLRSLTDSTVPNGPGVCVIFHEGESVFVSKGVGKEGLRGRLRSHRATDADLSRSTLRASVAVELLGVSRWTARQRPAVLPEWAIESVNKYLAECEVAWIECDNAEEASELKRGLLREYRPEYNLD